MGRVARRSFLALVGLGSAGLGGWFLRRVAEASPDSSLAGQWAAAEQDRRPLLIVVIPDDRSVGWLRGERLGEFVNLGGDAQMATLGLYEVVAARTAELAEVFPGIGVGDGSAVDLVRAWPREEGARTELLALPPALPPPAPEDGWWQVEPEVEEAAHVERMAELTAWARAHLVPGPAELAACAAANEAALPSRLRAELDSPQPGLAVLARGAFAWVVRARAAGRDEASIQSLLAASAADRFRLRAPAGTAWARSDACAGAVIEGSEGEAMGVDCGMGHVTRHQARFLHLYASS